MPDSRSRSSDCPFPVTPATPRISPARSSRLTRSRRSTPAASRQDNPSAASATGPGSAATGAASSWTLRPTISSASSSRVVVAGARCPTISPRRITETASVTSMISRSLWVISRIVTPSRFSALRMSNSRPVSSGVSTPVGSSRIRIRAPRLSAFRISTRCCNPTGSSPTTASGSISSPCSRLSRSSSARVAAMPGPSIAPPSAPSITFSSTVKVGTSMKC